MTKETIQKEIINRVAYLRDSQRSLMSNGFEDNAGRYGAEIAQLNWVLSMLDKLDTTDSDELLIVTFY